MSVTSTNRPTATGQICSTGGCDNEAAYKTRSKPAYCLDCIDLILLTGGLKPAEPFTGPDDWRLTTCLTCGSRAHYRLAYTLEKNAQGEATCRICHWTEWTAANGPSSDYAATFVLSADQVTASLGAKGFELVSAMQDGLNVDDPVLVRCRSCLRITANRLSDATGGHKCASITPATPPPAAQPKTTQNIRSEHPTRPRRAGVLLSESGHAALAWWDHDRNSERDFRTVTMRASRTCQWVCPDCGLSFAAKVLDMTALRPTCPDCEERRHAEWEERYERLKRTPISDVPELLAAWADDADPRTVMVADFELRRFRCPAGHHPRVSPTRFLDAECPSCRSARTRQAQKDWLADILPEIASQWHPTLNGKLTPDKVVWDSKRVLWWKAECCGHEWQESPRSRDKYARLHCPSCGTILGSLAWQDPGLAAEWSSANPLTPWQVRPHAKTSFVPAWVCATDPAHVWQQSLSARSNGAECPECRQAGKSKVELAHHAAAAEVFPGARSGALIRDEAFETRKSWTADISADVDGRTVVIEYDGAYWHAAAAKVLVDQSKTADLLAAGFRVVRLREDPLPPLALEHEDYKEIRVYATAPRPEAVMAHIRDWLSN
ncbi:zinc-ribbon domain-containing protein [Tersicoccus sp. MR15.9]|uniref:zinc-ribbon domain-containing protein n=1 Tax=Tersicoccus mangrovi TaxID=3121635 RepID=UPI002FE5BF98